MLSTQVYNCIFVTHRLGDVTSSSLSLDSAEIRSTTDRSLVRIFLSSSGIQCSSTSKHMSIVYAIYL